VGREPPEKVEVVFDGVSVEAEERVGRRALPTLPNAVFNGVKVREAICRRDVEYTRTCQRHRASILHLPTTLARVRAELLGKQEQAGSTARVEKKV